MLITQLQLISFDPFIHKNLRYPIPSCMMLIGSDFFCGRPPLLLNLCRQRHWLFWMAYQCWRHLYYGYLFAIPCSDHPSMRWEWRDLLSSNHYSGKISARALNYRRQASDQMFWIWCAISGLLALTHGVLYRRQRYHQSCETRFSMLPWANIFFV